LTVLALTAMTVSGLAMTASAEEPPAPVVAASDRPSPDQPEPVARGLIVKTTTSTPSDSLIDATDKALGDEAEVVDDRKLLNKVSAVQFDGDVPATVATDAAAEIEKRSDVVWATPDTLRRTQASPPVKPNDPLFASQRNLWDTRYAAPTGGYSIKAPSFWQVTKGRSDVTVAVLDTGIIGTSGHPDLAGSLVPGYDMVSDPFVSRDGNGRDSNPNDPGDWSRKGQCYRNSPAMTNSWHGTFVAGQIAATYNNKVGIAGVAPGVKVMPVRVLGRCGGYDSDIIAGIQWASGGHVEGVPDLAPEDRAEVVNLSLGGLARDSKARTSACLPYAEAAGQGWERGTLFVAAAGNDGLPSADLAIPASCGSFFSVGATSLRGFRAVYSNFGKSVDLSAPGGDTLVEGPYDSILGLGNTGKTSRGSSTYTRYEGTSMATPQVSAAAALILSYMRDNGMDTGSNERVAMVTKGLRQASSPFRKRVRSYDNKVVKVDGKYYELRYSLNCAERSESICGWGLLDLSRLEVPLGETKITGNLAIGEPLTVVTPWLSKPAQISLYWKRDGRSYGDNYLTRDDIGRTISVTVFPEESVLPVRPTATLEGTVPDGPEVVLSGLPGETVYGASGAVATVTVAGAGAGGQVELRRDSTTIATGQTNEEGVATIEVPGRKWAIGANIIRAAFLGEGTLSAASSPVRTQVNVDKANSAVTTSLISVIKHTSHAKLTVRVKVDGDPSPYGKIRIQDGSKPIVNTYLYASNGGIRTFSLPTLKPGTHQIKVLYYGNDNIRGRYSAYETIVSK